MSLTDLDDAPDAHQTAYDVLYQKLRTRMFEGDFMPGEAISIRTIAKEFNISPMPAREAIRRLVAEGALEFADRRKIIVPIITRDRFSDILYARLKLESELADRAFLKIGKGDIRKLKEIDAQMDRAIAIGDVRSYMRANFNFHFLIYRLADSPTMLFLVEILWLQYGPSMRFVFARWGTSAVNDDLHKAATDALEAGDQKAFREAIEEDIRQGMDLIPRD